MVFPKVNISGFGCDLLTAGEKERLRQVVKTSQVSLIVVLVNARSRQFCCLRREVNSEK